MKKNKRTVRMGRISKPAMLSQTIRQICLYSASALVGQAAFTANAWAAPQGGQIVGGRGAIQQNGNNTTIRQNSKSLAIDWQSFNLSNKESVRFRQPSSSSVALNRIFDQNASKIHGSISANGKVFLLNPNGIIFGKNASVNVGSLVAGTLDMSVRDFMDGRYDLAAPEGKDGVVVNKGLIQAAAGGSVTLVGGAVINEGVIVADYGHVNLAAGRKATLDFDGDGLIRFEVSEDVLENGDGLNDAVLNSGTIQAQGGQVYLTASAARDVFTNVVNNSGVIRAGRIDSQGGVIRLVGTGGNTIHSGTIDASGQDASSTGGTVHVLGDNVGLFDDASIDASGATGGGTVLVGGDYQGKNPDIKNAARTYVSADATINADATETGDGGKVVVWSDEVTRYYGNISARGGSRGGNGGFSEVSGKRVLDFQGNADLSAVLGTGGTLLLDPLNITISTAADSNTAGFTPPGDQTEAFDDDPGLTSNFDITAGTGSFAGVGAGTTIQLEATNDITVSNDWDLATSTGVANVSLILNAGNDVAINANLGATGTGTITLTADADFSGGGGAASDGTGAITQGGAGNTITQANGTLTLNAGSGITATTDVAAISATNSTSGDISITEANDIQVDAITNTGGGAVSLVSGGSINELVDDATDNIVTTGAVTLAGATGIGNTSALDLGGVTDLSLDTNGSFNVSTSGTITDLAVTVDPSGGGDTYTLVDNDAAAANLTFTVADNADTTNLDLTDVSVAAGDLNFALTADTGNINVGTIGAGTGTVSLVSTAGSLVDATSSITAGNLTLQANTAGQAIGATGAGAIDTTLSGALTASANTGAGGIYVSNTGDLTVGTVNAGTGDVELTALAAGSILDGNAGANNITADTAILTAAGSIGDLAGAGNGDVNQPPTDALDTAVSNLTVDAVEVAIDNTIAGGLTVTSATPAGAAGSVLIINDTDIAVTAHTLTPDGDSIGYVSMTGSITIPDAAINVGTGTIRVEALTDGQDVSDTTDTDLSNNLWTADTVAFASGTGESLDLSVDNLTANISDTTGGGAGDLTVTEADGITLNDIDTADGAIDVTATLGDITVVDIDAAGTNAVTLDSTAGNINDGAATTEVITADGLRLNAETGIVNLNTQVSDLAAETEEGNIQVFNTGALDVTTVDTLSGITITDTADNNLGDDILITASSPLTVSQAVTNNDGGDITLAAEGSTAADDLTVNAAVSTTGGTGAINLFAGDSVILQAAANISTASTGTVLVSAGEDYNGGANQNGNAAGSILMVDGAVVQSEDGTITLRAPGNIALGEVNADSDSAGGVGAVTVTADFDGVGAGLSDNAGAITEVTTAETANINASTLNLIAGSGIGAAGAGAIDVALTGTLTLNTGGDGFINSLGDLTLGPVTTANASADTVAITATAGSTIALANALNDATLVGDAFSFNSGAGGAFDGGSVNVDLGGTGTLSITADTITNFGDGLDNVGGGISVAAGTANATIGLGNLALANIVGQTFKIDNTTMNNLAAAGGGSLTVGDASSGAIVIDEVTFGANNLTLVSNSTIDDNDDVGAAFVSTGTLTLTSNGAIGGLNGAQGLDTDTGTLTVTSSGGNNVTVRDSGTGGDTTYNINTGGAGAIAATQVTNDLITGVGNTSTTATVNLTATAGDIVGSAGTVSGTTVTLDAGGGIGVGTAVNTDAGTLDLTTAGAGIAGNITVVDANAHNTSDVAVSTAATAQTVDLTAASWAVGGSLGNAVDALTLQTSGAGNIDGGAGTLTASTLTLNAGGGIGTGTPVNTDAGTLDLTTAGAGAAGNITVVDANAHNTSDVTLSTAATAQTVDLTAASWTVDAALGNAIDALTLRTSGAGNIDGGAGTLTASTLTLNAGGGIGTGTTVNTDAGTLALTTAGAGASGGIDVLEADGANIGATTVGSVQTINIASTTGDLTVTADVGDTADTVTLNAIAGDVVGGAGTVAGATVNLTAGGGIGIGTAVNTDAGTLNLTTAGADVAGNITVVDTNAHNTSDVTLNTALTTQVVDLTAASWTVDASRGNSTDILSLQTSGAGNIDGGAGTLTASVLILDAGGGIGTGTAVNTDAGTLVLNTAGANAAGNITVVDTNVGGHNTSDVGVSTDGTAQTVDITATSWTVDVSMGVAADALALRTSGAGDIDGGAGTLTASTLTLDAGGGIGTGTAVNTEADTLALTSAGLAGAGNITVIEADGANVGVTTAGTSQTINVESTLGDLTVTSDVGDASDTSILNAVAGNVVGGAGTVFGATVDLMAGGGIGVGTAVNTSAGLLGLTTTGAGAASNITIVDANAHNTSDVFVSTDGATAQTVDLTAASWNVDSDILGNTVDTLILRGAGDITDGGGNLMANNLTLQVTGGGSAIGSGAAAIDTTVGGSLTALAANGNGGIFVNNTGPLDIAAVDAGTGNIGLESSAQITDSGAISGNNLTTISVGGTTLDFGHTVSGIDATNTGSGDINFVNTGTLTVAATNAVGDVSIMNTGDVLLDLISAPGNTVNVTASGNDADILKLGGSSTNVESRIVNLTADSRIGLSPSEPVTLDINSNGEINLVFGAAEAFISNLNQTPVSVTGGGSVIDVVGAAIAGAGRAQDTELADIGFVDWSLFSEDLSLFGVVEPGIKLPKDQIEDDLVLKMPEPDVPLLVKTASGWEFMWAYQRTALGEAAQPGLHIQQESF